MALQADVDQVMVVSEENVRVQCSNSTDFVVGKQTNFNGPVTIINCPTPQAQSPENVVIREQILTETAAQTLQARAKNSESERGNEISDSIAMTDNPSGTSLPKKPGVHSGPILVLKDLSRKKFLGLSLMFWIICAFVVVVSLVATIAELTRTAEEGPLGSNTDDRLFVGNESHLFFTKNKWGGLNASSSIPITEPVPYVVISHTAGAFCYETVTCQEVVQSIQKDHMSRTPPFADIAFNFMVGGDGYIYEGRGWGVRSPHTGFLDNYNIDITFLGDFSVYSNPTNTQVDAVKKLLELGVNDCHLRPDYVLMAHNATTNTLSPGKNVYRIISQWDHFRSLPPLTGEPFAAGLDSACPHLSPFRNKQDTLKVANKNTNS